MPAGRGGGHGIAEEIEPTEIFVADGIIVVVPALGGVIVPVVGHPGLFADGDGRKGGEQGAAQICFVAFCGREECDDAKR